MRQPSRPISGTPLTTLSNNLAALSPNSMFSGNTFTPGMTVTATNAAVFNIDLSALTTAGNLTFAGCLSSSDPATRCNAVINVIGSGTLDNTHLVFPAGLTGIGNFPNIIVNFEDGVTDVVDERVDGVDPRSVGFGDGET